MGADYNEMIAKLQAGLAQSQNQGPSLFGLQAQQDPNVMSGLLNHLQQQQYVQQQGNQQGDWADQFANAGRKDFARAGQNLAGVLGIGQPQQLDNSNVMAQRAAITQGKQDLAQGLAQPGADPNQVQLQVLNKLAQAGVPNAADALEKAQASMLKNKLTEAETQQKAAQAQSYAAADARDKAKEARERLQNTWNPDPTTKTDQYHDAQINGLGDRRTIVKGYQPNAASMNAAAAADPQSVNYVAEYMKQNGGNSPPNMRNPLLTQAAIKLLASQGDAGDTVAGMVAQHAQNKSDTAALTQTQKQLSATSSYVATMDKNISQVEKLSKGLDFTDQPTINKAFAAWQKGTSDPQYAKYNLFFNAAANEFAKIQSGSLGNAPVTDAARHEASAVMSQYMGPGGMAALADGMRLESKNRVDSLTAERDALVGRLGKKPSARAAAPTPEAPAAAQGSNVVDFGSLK